MLKKKARLSVWSHLGRHCRGLRRGCLPFLLGDTSPVRTIRRLPFLDGNTARMSAGTDPGRMWPCGEVLEPGGCTAFRSHSNSNMLTHSAREAVRNERGQPEGGQQRGRTAGAGTGAGRQWWRTGTLPTLQR